MGTANNLSYQQLPPVRHIALCCTAGIQRVDALAAELHPLIETVAIMWKRVRSAGWVLPETEETLIPKGRELKTRIERTVGDVHPIER